MNPIIQLIDEYAAHHLNRNVQFAQNVASLVQNAFVLKPKDRSEPIAAAQALLSKNKIRAIKPLPPPPDINYMESLLSDVSFCQELAEMEELVTSDMFKLLNILFNALIDQDGRTVETILAYIFSVRQFTLADVTCSEITNNIKFCKNDVIWYLWWVVQLAANRIDDQAAAFVQANLAIFTTLYQKKSRESRIPILIHTWRSIAKGGLRQGTKLVDVFAPPVAKKATTSSVTKTTTTTTKTGSGTMQQQHQYQRNDSETALQYEYLRVYTYKKDDYQAPTLIKERDEYNEKTLVFD